MNYTEGSPISRNFLKHVEIMKSTNNQPENTSFTFPKEDYIFDLLYDLANNLSCGQKRFVIVEWDDIFEVHRTQDFVDVKLFYKHLNKPKKEKEDFEKAKGEIKRIVSEFLAKGPEEELKKYLVSGCIKSEDFIIAKSYINRRLVSLSTFKDFKGGATKSINSCCDILESEGFFTKVNADEALEKYKTGGCLYRLNKPVTI